MVDIEQLKRTIIGFWQSEGTLRMLQHIFVVIIFFRIIFSYRFQKRGKIGVVDLLVKRFLRLFGKLSFVRKKMQKELEAKASQTVLGMVSKKSIKPTYSHIPNEGLKHQFLLNEIDVRKQADIDPTVGKTFAYVYEYSKKHSKFTAECFQKYIHSNALNPLVFNSLRVFEVQTIRMVANLFNGDQKCVGSVTSCGTESLILAMKIYRDYRGKGQVLMCTTGHPGINKGCDYVGLDVVQIPYDKNFKMDLKQLRKKISTNTVVVVCSAAQYPHGVVDNIEQVAKICLKYGVPLHVDAAIGGFVLPFIEMLGQHKFRPWDFRVKGVTSINADVHKYGYCPKGASVLICANSEIRRKQFYTFATWPGGIYFSPTILGSRNGGAIVAAWGALLGLGLQGYKQSTRRILKICQKIKEAIRLNPDLELVVEPQMTIITFTSKTINVFELADCLDTKGFHAQKQENCLHLSIMPQHQPIVDDLIIKLNQAVKQVKESPKKYESGSRAVYGSLAKIPDQVIVQQFVSYFTDEIYKFH